MSLLSLGTTLRQALDIFNNAIRPRSGEWITTKQTEVVESPAGLLVYTPIAVPRPLVVTHIGLICVSTAPAITDASARVGLYADDGTGLAPGARLADAGALALSDVGFASVAFAAPLSLGAGIVWAAAVLHGATFDNADAGPYLDCMGTQGEESDAVVANPATIVDPTTRCQQESGVSGALPASAGTLAPAAHGFRLFLQVE